ncbi:hypothetical protein A2Z22_03090 [Candidatus Woesebacteria bacterium RBG_16_34_12]|uniref:Glycosyltransferase RgtA/B/C/D-like domain-containing protein n=1 Tax=Candidatus Woesebacteria bacterium RBG_16_34_12 TaxID=1802480 RepID=A0A1F7X6Y8_9BACT|nr:MAG: hypothetical protein A2Z22_03090 [Candidatus Woesebacteria bacterium RBG_16_34_12]
MENQFTTSIWGDEGFSAILSMKSLPEIIQVISRDTSPPLWNITEWFAFQLFGTSEIVIRSLAFLYFLAAIFFTYKIGKLLWNKKTGILAAILTFLNPFFFIYAFEGRMYSIMSLGVAASMYFFLKILYSQKSDKKDLAGYVIGTLWAIYSHHFAIFIIFIQGLWFLYKLVAGNRKQVTSLFIGFLLVGVGYLPWLYPLYQQTKMVGGGFWLGTPTFKDLVNLIEEYLATGIKHDLSKSALLLTLIILFLRKWNKEIQKTLILLSWFLGPIVLTWLISQVFQSIFFNRYLLYTIPGAMLIIASERRKINNIILLLLLPLLLLIDLHYFTHPIKRPFKQLASYVKQTQKQGDYLINWNSSSHHLWETKYYDIPAPIYIPEGSGNLPFFVGTALMEKDDIVRKSPDSVKRIGVVTSGPVEEINLPGYTENEVKNFKNTWEGSGEIKFIWYIRE